MCSSIEKRTESLLHRMRFQLDDKGATSIEYAILGSLIAAVIVLVVTTLGIQVRTLFETVMQGW